eukprot:1156271-Pelagomonas_calceolata.AAC.6
MPVWEAPKALPGFPSSGSERSSGCKLYMKEAPKSSKYFHTPDQHTPQQPPKFKHPLMLICLSLTCCNAGGMPESDPKRERAEGGRPEVDPGRFMPCDDDDATQQAQMSEFVRNLKGGRRSVADGGCWAMHAQRAHSECVRECTYSSTDVEGRQWLTQGGAWNSVCTEKGLKSTVLAWASTQQLSPVIAGSIGMFGEGWHPENCCYRFAYEPWIPGWYLPWSPGGKGAQHP